MSSGISQSLIAATAASIARDKLAAFGAAVLREHRSEGGCDIDGGQLERMALAAGVLEARRVVEPCGPECACECFGAIPGSCNFIPDAVAAEIRG